MLPTRLNLIKNSSNLLNKFNYHVGLSWSSKPRLKSEENFKLLQSYKPDHKIKVWVDEMLSDRKEDFGDAGEDFWFKQSMKGDKGLSLGLADGVGGWFSAKIDPSKFSQTLMYYMSMSAKVNDINNHTPLNIISDGFKGVLNEDEVKAGSSTACVLTLNNETGILKGANIGDSTYLLIRDYKVIESTKQQSHFFNCPFQLSKLRKGIDKNHINDSVNSADLFETELKNGDCIILFSDGLGDNVFNSEIIQLLEAVESHLKGSNNPSEKSQAFADTLVSYAKICMNDEFKVRC